MKHIKNNLIIVFLFILIINNSYGQTHSLGVHFGPNFSKLRWEDKNTETNFKTGILVGINYQVTFPNSKLAEVDLIYFEQGFINELYFSDNMGNPTGTGEIIFNYDYIGIPLKFGVSLGDKIKIIPKAGLVPSYLISAKTKADVFEDGGIVGEDIIDVTDKVTRFDLAALVEVSMEYPFNNDFSIFSSLSFRHSFTAYSNDNYFGDLQMRHYNFPLLVGLKYNLSNNPN